MIRIMSMPLYPRASEPLMPNDPPKSCAWATRYNDWRKEHVSPPWPEVSIGAEIEVETLNHWVWSATLESIRDGDYWIVRPIDKQALPLPPIVPGQPYILPYVSGDAWSVRPQQGLILTIEGQHYKVTHKPKPVGTGYEYRLAPVSPAEHAKRPGRVKITDHTDPNPGNHHYYGHNIGRVVQVGDEWLHVQEIKCQPYGSGEGDEVFGYTTWGVGHFVPTAKAAKLKAEWEAKEKTRGLELQLRVAQNDLDYGGNPDAVPRLRAVLDEARKSESNKKG